ncbi:MAG: amidohydrolase family protein [Rhizobacter sp.]|nr:amidohydrolase family protein [Chlorobiales bacterium]
MLKPYLRFKLIPLHIFLLVFLSAPLHAQTPPMVFRGALIYPIEGEPIANGVLVVQGGKILAVGKAADVVIPAGAVVQDVSGKVVMPGLVDTHSHIGRGDGADASAPLQPSVRIMDALDPQSDGFKRARAGGLTTVNVMPGSGHLLSGQTAYLKLRDARTINDLLLCVTPNKPVDVLDPDCIYGGIKMANGTNSIRPAPFPGTRAKSAAMVRALFVRAQEYRDKIKAAAGNAERMPKRELELEALVQVLNGQRIVHHHTHRADDILTVLRIAKEFGFRVVLHHVSEGGKVAAEIAAAKVPCSIITIDSPGGKLEAVNLMYETGAALEKAGVLTAYHTDDGITDSRLFLRSAAMGVRGGMSRQKALEAVTLAGAKMLDLDWRVGSLKAGKDADFIVLSGDPLSVYTHIEQTWIEGRKLFDRSNPEDYKFAVGGYNAYRDTGGDGLDDKGGER